jgi:hypothetical protein
MASLDDLEFRVEQWDAADAHVEELLAAAGNVTVARAAFDAAVQLRPQARIQLRHRARVIARYEPKKQTKPADPFGHGARVIEQAEG